MALLFDGVELPFGCIKLTFEEEVDLIVVDDGLKVDIKLVSGGGVDLMTGDTFDDELTACGVVVELTDEFVILVVVCWTGRVCVERSG
jgi:hypothetical protein